MFDCWVLELATGNQLGSNKFIGIYERKPETQKQRELKEGELKLFTVQFNPGNTSFQVNDNDCTQFFLLGISFSNTVSSDKLDKFAFRPPLLLSRRRSPAGPIFHHHGQLVI
ncbi:hypothetical protein L2E82_27328 [Cichorium intybus]|uniref:Uncharacterized protein n=1 Tax=Cichorium intybus TaxID=13427 RepID=A0ACB9CSZ5_CICIN|nr:hypothetical protein L2E82_27328 [Cichorium intybus]